MTFERITVRPGHIWAAFLASGVSASRSATVVGMVADGMGPGELLAAYPVLEAVEVKEALHYAAEGVQSANFRLSPPVDIPRRLFPLARFPQYRSVDV